MCLVIGSAAGLCVRGKMILPMGGADKILDLNNQEGVTHMYSYEERRKGDRPAPVSGERKGNVAQGAG